MGTQNPLKYMVEQTKVNGIDMHCACDGVVLYDGQVACPYIDEDKPHAIYQSGLRNRRRLVILEEPDLDRPGKPSPEGEVLGSVYTFKIIEELDDVHESDGQYMIRVRPDGSIEKIHAKEGNHNHKDPKDWIDFLVQSFLE